MGNKIKPKSFKNETIYICIYIYIYIYIIAYIYIYIHLYTYMQSWKQFSLPVITTMAM